MYWIHFYALLSCNHDFFDHLYNSLPLSTNTLFGLQPDSSKDFWKTLVIVIPFFKGTTRALLSIIISYLLINCISLRSAPQLLCLIVEYNFYFSNFLLIGLCNFSAISWFMINSLITAPSANLFAHVAEVLLSKKL